MIKNALLIFLICILIAVLFILCYSPKAKNIEIKEKFISYESDCAGFNNQRMGSEILFTIANLYNRTIILPPRTMWPNVNEKCVITDYFDIDKLRKKYSIMLSSEWKPTQKMNYNQFIAYMENRNTFKQRHLVNPERNTFLECKNIFDKNQKEEVWFFRACRNNMKERMFGNFDAYFLKHPMKTKLRNDIIISYKFIKDIRSLVWKTLKKNGITKVGEYNAVHIRRTDFSHYRPNIFKLSSQNSIIRILKKYLDNKKLLIISDETNPEYFKPFYKHFNVIKLKYENYIPTKFIGILDMLSGVYAHRFIGTPLSTFSYYIITLRNYLNKNIDKKAYFTAENFDALVKNNKWEFKNGWSQIDPERLISP